MVPIEPVWHAVLKKYRELGGVGLSGNLLVHLTGIPWPELKEQIVKYNEDTPERQGTSIFRDWCHTERAWLLIYGYGVKPHGYDCEKFDPITEQINKYPPDKYPSIKFEVGQKTINLYNGSRTYKALQGVVRRFGIEPGNAPYGVPKNPKAKPEPEREEVVVSVEQGIEPVVEQAAPRRNTIPRTTVTNLGHANGRLISW